MISDRLTAAMMVVGFEVGLYCRADVGVWVAAEVERLDVLPNALLELTTLGGKHDVEVASLLRELMPEPLTVGERARLEMAALYELASNSGMAVHDAVHAACRIARDLSPEEYRQALGLEDEHELARAGIYGTTPEVERGFLEFLRRYAPGDE